MSSTTKHYVVRSKKQSCPFGLQLLNQGFGTSPEEAWEDACGPDWAGKRGKVRRSRWWLCECDGDFFHSEGRDGDVGPACDDPTK
tara:strand:+ start:1473 stop:1727 length:255 start_codon:yes stop_codon:yes gene_type:complete